MFFKALETVKKYNMISFGDSVVCGVSGGADSTALLLFICSLREEYGINVYAVHVHHGIRGDEADGDCAFVEELCQRLNVPLKVKKYDIIKMSEENGLSEEENGRKARYAEFEKESTMHKNCKIAVAHNRNDQAETVLMRLCRGSGLSGLCAIRPVRGKIIRPLLFCSRQEIEDYLIAENQSFRNDSTNFQEEYTRNKLRLRVLPYLEKNVNSASIKNIAKAAELLADEDEYMEKTAEKAFETVFLGKTEINIELDKNKLLLLDAVIQRRVLRMAAVRLKKDIKDISFVHVENTLALLKSDKGHIDMPNGLKAEVHYGKLCMSLETEKKMNKGFSYVLEEDKPVFVRECGLYFELTRKKNKTNFKYLYTKSFDYDKISGVVFVRSRIEGDRICINRNGNSKTIKKLLIDCKIPCERREEVPLIAFSNEVIWAVGIRSSAFYETGKDSENICCVNVWRI